MDRSWRDKFIDAISGLIVAWRGHSSFRVHICCALCISILGYLIDLESWRWTVLVGAIAGVIAAELLNTAIEHLARAITRNQHPEIKAALDIAAAAVLFTALAATALGVIAMGEPMITWLRSWQLSIW